MPTEHAKLPLWVAKNPTEKAETLWQLYGDAATYAAVKNINLAGFESIAREPNPDLALDYILNLYRSILIEDTARVVNLLHSHTPADAKEAADISQMLLMIEQNPNIFNMNCENGHLTGSALVVDLTSGSVLLHLHKKLNKWLQFGGHPEYETDLAEVALREGAEETGLTDLQVVSTNSNPSKPVDIDLHIIPEGKGRPEHYHLDLRYILGTHNPDQVAVDSSQESNNFVWFKFEDVGSMAKKIDAPLIRLIEKARQVYTSLK